MNRIHERPLDYATVAAAIMCSIMLSLPSSGQETKSGFLGDYSKLHQHPDPRREGAMVYAKPGLSLKAYKAVYIAYPHVQLASSDRQQTVDPRDLTELADYFHDKLVGAIEDTYELADEPGPGVLVVRSCIVDVNPISRVAGVAGKLALKVVNLDVGGASIEAELVDGDSGEQLAALVESKKADRVEVGMQGAKKWGHAKAAFKDWAELLDERLGELGMAGVSKAADEKPPTPDDSGEKKK